jgi:VWFA-related protein
VNNASAGAQKAQKETGLSTWGEFGPELSVILADTARGKVTFSHWEQAPAGLVAVYRYAVPRAASHYTVNYCCYRTQDSNQQDPMVDLGRSRNQQTVMASPEVAVPRPFTDRPGYHGTISIDPATGAILRIALEADLKTGDPIGRVASVVEYGPVKIGDRSFICPVRSLAITKENPALNGHPTDSPALLVNETSFTNYHRLGTTVRILSGATEPGYAEPANTNPREQLTETPAAGNPAPPVPAAPAPPELSAAEPAPPAQPFNPEITLTPATGVPDESASAPLPQDSGYSLKVNARLVDVNIVVYDKKGHPVKDLKPEDFEVYDTGRKQEVRFFSQLPGQAPAALAAGENPDRTFANRSSDAAAVPSATGAPEAGATILLIDESHIAWNDMANARQQILKFLGTVAPGEPVGLYTMTGFGFRVLTEITTDHAALIARLRTWMPTAKSVSQAQEEEIRNRQQFNTVHNIADLNTVNGNHIDVPDSTSPVDPQLLTLGSNPARAGLIIMGGVARHLSSVPGHKNLVWISSDNVFADWRDQEVGIDRDDKRLDSFALRAQEEMNDAHVAVYPLDVSQLEGGAINADIQNRNVVLTPAAQDIASLPGSTAASSAGDAGGLRNMRAGRNSAEMSQDLHPIQGPIRQVADGTGGRAIQRAGDLATELAGIVDDGHATYLLSFSPQGPADDKYHIITVKLTGKQHGLTPRYRTGYLFQKEPATLKDRYHQSVWRPGDVSEISLIANVIPMNPGAQVKIDIAAGDLGLRQQEGRWRDKLDIFFIQRDDAGLHAQVEGQTLGLRLKSSTYQSLIPTGVPFERFVQLRPGMASLRVLVVDENTRRMGSVTIPGTALEAAH